ncbi:hypothetical protein C8R44DRAFT_870954 [Mycena epipterygia]|nr:hypothetical protein C8R44DRAFT_870954 [Mycena epipterygia]
MPLPSPLPPLLRSLYARNPARHCCRPTPPVRAYASQARTRITLVHRGGCEFLKKVRAAQRLGGDNPRQHDPEDASDIKIASTFIKSSDSLTLSALVQHLPLRVGSAHTLAAHHCGVQHVGVVLVRLSLSRPSPHDFYFIDSPIPIIAFIVILLLPSMLRFITLIIHRVRASQDRAPHNLPWRVWTGSGWEKHDSATDPYAPQEEAPAQEETPALGQQARRCPGGHGRCTPTETDPAPESEVDPRSGARSRHRHREITPRARLARTPHHARQTLCPRPLFLRAAARLALSGRVMSRPVARASRNQTARALAGYAWYRRIHIARRQGCLLTARHVVPPLRRCSSAPLPSKMSSPPFPSTACDAASVPRARLPGVVAPVAFYIVSGQCERQPAAPPAPLAWFQCAICLCEFKKGDQVRAASAVPPHLPPRRGRRAADSVLRKKLCRVCKADVSQPPVDAAVPSRPTSPENATESTTPLLADSDSDDPRAM